MLHQSNLEHIFSLYEICLSEHRHVFSDLIWGHRSAKARWDTDGHIVVRDFHSLWYYGSGSDQRIIANLCTIEHGCSHSNQGIIPNGASMNHRAMSYRRVLANDNWIPSGFVKNAVFLDVAFGADDDRRAVGG